MVSTENVETGVGAVVFLVEAKDEKAEAEEAKRAREAAIFMMRMLVVLFEMLRRSALKVDGALEL